MDFEKIRTDYEKRYGKRCEKIFFSGLPITFFGKDSERISGCLSLGEALALSARDDGRITVQVSGSDGYESFNLSCSGKNDNRIVKLLDMAKKRGITTGGADLFLFRNSRLTDLLEPLVLGGLSGFCQNVPPREKLLPHFDNFEQNVDALSGKAGHFTVFDLQRKYYLSFFGGKIKIVIVDFGEGSAVKRDLNLSSAKDAICAVKKNDFEKFSMLLTKESKEILRRNKADKELGHLEFAEKCGDGVGCGILGEGKMFVLVQNEKTDTFIRNLSLEYRKFRGGTPEFYVTDLVDSGIFK